MNDEAVHHRASERGRNIRSSTCVAVLIPNSRSTYARPHELAFQVTSACDRYGDEFAVVLSKDTWKECTSMPVLINATHDPKRFSWVASANLSDAQFPIQNLPFGVFRLSSVDGPGRCGIAIGNAILDVANCAPHFTGAAQTAAEACAAPQLNDLMALGAEAWSSLRAQVSDLLLADNEFGREALSNALYRLKDVTLLTPVKVVGFIDFFTSINHATNAGRLFRPDEPLFPNYKYVPIGYNGRASSIMLSGTSFRRPKGQIMLTAATTPAYAPSRQLDYEVELGVYLGKSSRLGETVPIDKAWDHVFGVSLLNDWSARDIQAWEYRPLGPFLGKSFATTVGPWVVTAEALAPFRVAAAERPAGDPKPLPHLFCEIDARFGGVDIVLDCGIRSERMREKDEDIFWLSRTSARTLYWTIAQMIAHQTSNGCSLQIGDFIGSGTISGATRESLGSLLEITYRGKEPLLLPSGETRAFLEDGDEVVITGRCEREGFVPIGLGECAGHISPPNPA